MRQLSKRDQMTQKFFNNEQSPYDIVCLFLISYLQSFSVNEVIESLLPKITHSMEKCMNHETDSNKKKQKHK